MPRESRFFEQHEGGMGIRVRLLARKNSQLDRHGLFTSESSQSAFSRSVDGDFIGHCDHLLCVADAARSRRQHRHNNHDLPNRQPSRGSRADLHRVQQPRELPRRRHSSLREHARRIFLAQQHGLLHLEDFPIAKRFPARHRRPQILLVFRLRVGHDNSFISTRGVCALLPRHRNHQESIFIRGPGDDRVAGNGRVLHTNRLHRHHQFVLLRDDTQSHEQN